MRDLTKSMLRFSWAMSVFGARQAASLLGAGAGRGELSNALDTMSHAAESELDRTSGQVYRVGEQLQSGMVDTLFHFADRSRSGPVLKKAWSAIDRSWSEVRNRMSAE